MTNTGLPIWLQIVLAILVALAAFGGLVGGIYAARSARSAAREQRVDQMSADDHARAEVWNAGYRAAAEKHLEWDGKILAALSESQREINILREQLKLAPHQFPAIPEKPPLFPGFTAAAKS